MAKTRRGATAPQGDAYRVDLAELERILKFMAEHGVEELEYQAGAFHVRLRKPAAVQMTAIGRTPGRDLLHAAMPAPTPAAHTVLEVPSAAPSLSAQVAASVPADNLHIVKSPIVGTFYAAPSPGSPNFVKVGDTVSAGQVLCIVEAMKLMNEIEADHDGEVVRCLVDNGQPVEYGQGLFALRPVSLGKTGP